MTENAIEIANLTKHFASKIAVDNVSFNVKKGTIFALLGANGAGKTTIINMLTTLITADAGEVSVMGASLNDPSKIRAHISVTGQFAALDEELTGFENLELLGRLNHLPRDVVRARANTLLAEFNLSDARNKLVKNYSGGMKRRLDIAGSLVANPEIIFLDEPTTGIDPQNRLVIWEMIKSLADNGTTVFLTTQYLEEAENLASEAVILNEGKIIAGGFIDDLKRGLPEVKVIVRFIDEAQLLKVHGAINNLTKETKMVSTKLSDDTIEVIGSDKVYLLENLFRLVEFFGIDLVDVNIKDASLEDVYLHLLGGVK